MSAEAKLKERSITLPTPATPVANYVGAVRVGNLLFVSGHGPLRQDGKPSAHGKVGKDLTVEQGYQVAREVGLSLLATPGVRVCSDLVPGELVDSEPGAAEALLALEAALSELPAFHSVATQLHLLARRG